MKPGMIGSRDAGFVGTFSESDKRFEEIKHW